MGNKLSKKQKSWSIGASTVTNNDKQLTQSSPIIGELPKPEYYRGEYTILPTAARFQKIDIVEFGKEFDNWNKKYFITTIPRNHRSETLDKWYLHPSHRSGVIRRLSTPFPLQALMEYAVVFNQLELLEFICMQELIEIDYWCSELWLAVIIETIQSATKKMKLGSLKVLASCMIPERLNQKDFEAAMGAVSRGSFSSNSDGARHEKMCQDMIVEGMNGRAKRIIQTRDAFRENVNYNFPESFSDVIIEYAFGLPDIK